MSGSSSGVPEFRVRKQSEFLEFRILQSFVPTLVDVAAAAGIQPKKKVRLGAHWRGRAHDSLLDFGEGSSAQAHSESKPRDKQ